MSPDLLDEMIAKKFVSEQTHPTAPLRILNYSPKAQFDREWNEVTTQCRGLIVNSETGEVVARPFRKFHNLGEMDIDLPAEDFEVTEKMDGSLGILYRTPDDKAHIATRGSFTSEQSEWGTKMLRNFISSNVTNFLDGKTYLFEIIHPKNRIVVDYGGISKLVLLAVIDNETGKDDQLPEWYRPLVKRHDGIKDVHELKSHEEENREGFCIRFANGLRLKIKFDEYVRLHRIVTQINARHIWEYLKDNKPLDEVLDKVPDEFFRWVRDTEKDLRKKYAEIEQVAQSDFDGKPKTEDRKELAQYFTKCDHPVILFKMLDGKDYKDIIWKQIKPKAEVPFKEDIDA